MDVVTPRDAGSEAAGEEDAVQRALFRPVRLGNAFEETVERLLQAIKLGVVAPGERLIPERELAARFNVSRVTLREALRVLGNEGYLESRRGRYGGSFVAPTLPTRPGPTDPRRRQSAQGTEVRDVRDLEDVLVFRRALECGAAEAAARRRLSAAERRHLTTVLAACGRAEVDTYRRMDSRLHLAVAEVTGSASLTSAVADARTRLNELLDAIPLLPPNLVHSNAQHAVLVEAILAGDAVGARQAMEEHLAGTTSLLRGFLA